MASPRRPAAATTTALLLAAVIVAGCGDVTQATPTVVPSAAAQATGSPAASAPPPAAGRELYGYLPYWEMDEGIVDHLATTPLSTLALFSVTHTASGGLRTGQAGYERITGDLGRRVIAQAHERGSRVELVYTSFGRGRNRKLFASQPLQDAVIASLVGLAGELALDGVNVDVEALDPELVPAYGAFVGRLHDAVVAADPGDRVTRLDRRGAAGGGDGVGGR